MLESRIKPQKRAKIKLELGGKVSELELSNLLNVFTELLDTLGDFVTTLGEIENKYPGLVEKVRNITSDPSLLKQFSDSVPPDVLGGLFRVLIHLVAISPELDKLTSLPSPRKISLGKEIKNISDE